MTVVFSRRDAEWFAPPGGTGRRYLVAPLTYRERQAFRADLAREGGIYPSHAQMLDALRAAVREASPDNADDLLAVMDASEATPDDAAVQVQLGTIEAGCATVPVYAGLLAARQRYLGTLPWVAARHALRGWEGDGLPPFRRARGLVPDDPSTRCRRTTSRRSTGEPAPSCSLGGMRRETPGRPRRRPRPRRR